MKDLVLFASTAVHRNGCCAIDRETIIRLFRAPKEHLTPESAKALSDRLFPNASGWFGINWSAHIIPDSIIERYIATRQAGTRGNIYLPLSLWGVAFFLPRQNRLHAGTVMAVTEGSAKKEAEKLATRHKSSEASYSVAITKIPAKLLREEEPPASASDQSIREQFAGYLSAGKS